MKIYRPTTPGRRGMTKADGKQLTKKVRSFKKLLKIKKSKAGRSRQGRITTRHKGGGHKKKYRIIDFKRIDKFGIPAKVESIEYDPNRSCFIALITYQDKEKRYILAPQDLKKDDEIIADEKTPLKPGNRMFLKIEGGYAQLTLPSGEVRMVLEKAMASIGILSNPEHVFVNLGKAGRKRWLGIRPTVRGSAMVPADHPHGGGEGRAPIGIRKGPKTPWGKQVFGVKTRKKKKYSDKFIIKRRKKKKRS